MTTFCKGCGGFGFCLPKCPQSSPRVQYYQRSAWQARVMRDTLTSPEQKQYWEQELMQAEMKLQSIARRAA